MSTPTVQPASEPIYTKGNWFWQGEERFLIKGISYVPRKPGGDPYETESKIDPLDETRINELKRDIDVFRELGLNTIQVSALNPDNSYSKAMDLLADAGIYVLVTLFDDLKAPNHGPHNMTEVDPHMDTAPYYTTDRLKAALKIVDEMADYPNLIGFVVAAEAINMPALSKLAEVYRAAVLDLKAWLRVRGGRCPPVGVSINEVVMMKKDLLEYFTAGDRRERADFFAMDCWSWVHKSSFHISGWKSMVEFLGKYPVPMYLSAFGGRAGKPRLWQKIGCLYSPDMTGVFSGGCLYTYLESGNRYGIVYLRADGDIQRKDEFARLKTQYEKVNARTKDEQYTADCKDYETWVGVFPTHERWHATTNAPRAWHATSDVPRIPGGLESLIQELTDEKEWELVDKDVNVEVADYGDTSNGDVDRLTDQVGKLTVGKET
jgi:hypothetical protein